MAGHSKWKNIQHRKNRQDAIKGKIFTKISKEIFVAVKRGGDDPNTNSALRLALQKARQNNMPSSNVENTIKKAIGDIEGVVYEEIVYEGYGPGGVAVMVECLTDNRNRTAAEVRHIFSKNGGNLGESGCVAFLFSRKGVITLPLEENGVDEETLMMEALEAGAEDMETDGGLAEITTSAEDFEAVKEALEKNGRKLERAEITQVPSTTVKLRGEDAERMMKLIDMLEDNDDVQNVHANFEIDEQ
jgi:YebC/PmpR family DNA-binding regulatory protein